MPRTGTQRERPEVTVTRACLPRQCSKPRVTQRRILTSSPDRAARGGKRGPKGGESSPRAGGG